MGVKELWSILAPAKQEIPLENLKGQTIAVDLSVWICENNGVKAVQGRVVKPHLRNLFFRVSNLLQLGVKLIFVIDGEAPDLKWETISNRINARFPGRGRGKRGGENPRKKSSRSHFKSLIRECTEMLDFLGVPYVQSQGEAEAMCALLNQQGVVDACITEDGDAFLYGARWVYRNFNLSSKDPVISSYKMADIEDLGYSRETLVALAMLLGCDFVPKGVPGVGKVQAVNLVSHLIGEDILARFRDWARGKVAFQKSLPDKPSHCSRCHHAGTAQSHRNGGCPQCGGETSCTATKKTSPCTCAWHCAKEEFDESSLERDIMTKALQVTGFPQQEVIDEFLITKDVCPRGSLERTRPHMVHLMKFALEKLGWVEEYTRSKVVELVTLYDLEAPSSSSGPTRDPLVVDHVVKKRTRSGVPCLEVAWVLPDSWQLEEEESNIICTIERLDLLRVAHPAIVADFDAAELSKKTKKKGPPGRKAVKAIEDSTNNPDDDTTEAKSTAPIGLEATITDQLSKMNLEGSDPLDGSEKGTIVRDGCILSQDKLGCKRPTVVPFEEQANAEGDMSPNGQSDRDGAPYLPSLRERLKGRDNKARGRCYRTDGAVDLIHDSDVENGSDPNPGGIGPPDPRESSNMRADAKNEEVGRSASQEGKRSNIRDIMDVGDGMVEETVFNISSDGEDSSPDMEDSMIDLCTVADDALLRDLSHGEVSIVLSGHIQRLERKKKPDSDINDLGEVNDRTNPDFLHLDTSRALNRCGASWEPDGPDRESANSESSRTLYSTFPAPQEVDTPAVTLADDLLEQSTDESSLEDQAISLSDQRWSKPLQHLSHVDPGEPSTVVTGDKMLKASSLHQRLLLAQMAASSRRGKNARTGCDQQERCSRQKEIATRSWKEQSTIASFVQESRRLEKTEMYELVIPDTSVADQADWAGRQENSPLGVVCITDVDERGSCCTHQEGDSEWDSAAMIASVSKELCRIEKGDTCDASYSEGSTDRRRNRITRTQDQVTGMGAQAEDVQPRDATPEPTLIDLETPFQTPLQTPQQTPSTDKSTRPKVPGSTSSPQTPLRADASSMSSQFASFSHTNEQSPHGSQLSGSLATFLTADMETPASVRLSALDATSSHATSASSSPEPFSTPEGCVEVERSQNHSMFQDLNFSLETSLWSPWNASMKGLNQPSEVRKSESMPGIFTKPGIESVEKSPVRTGKRGRAPVMKNGDVTGHDDTRDDQNKSGSQSSVAEGFSTPPGGSLQYSPGVHTGLFESPATSPLIENLSKVLNMELLEAEMAKLKSGERSQVLRGSKKSQQDGGSLTGKKSSGIGECTTGAILTEPGISGIGRNTRVDTESTKSKTHLRGPSRERGSLLDLSSQMERLRIEEQASPGRGAVEASDWCGKVALGRMEDPTIQQGSGGVFSSAGKQQDISGVFSLAEKENSPVSLMDRLRKRSTRHRKILKSMDLDQ